MDIHNQTQDPISNRDSHRVQFYPPLFEQRRAWILDVLRGERPRISSILDIGCGEGTLLSVLCQPAECHPTPDDFDGRFRVPNGDEIRLQSVIDTVESMYLKEITGLDVSSGVLELAKGLLENQANGYTFLPPKPRWQELKVQLWRGGLEEYNPAFNGYDCIVSTEVYVPLLPTAST
jgi:SAM-dependent methyltransferase